MRLFFVVSLLSIVFLSRGQGKIDVLHYKFSIELSDDNDIIKGHAEITISKFHLSSRLGLNLTEITSKGKGMKIDSIKCISSGKVSIIPLQPESRPGWSYIHSGDELTIVFPVGHFNNAERDVIDTVLISIDYHGVPGDGLIISKNKYGHRTFFADNWPNRAHNWIPCVDDVSDKASVEFFVTAPSHYQVISNGIRVEETNLLRNKKLTHYKEDVPLPTKVMVIGVADFAVDKVADVNGVPVSSWVFPENKKEGFYDYAVAKDILAFFINYIGPFPYKKLANVQSKTIFGGMENAGAIFYSENSVTGDRQEEPLLAHEIAHQWFGDMATEKSFAHLWLSEGFATYLAHIYMEEKYGKERFNKEMQAERDKIIGFVKRSRKPVVDSVSSFMDLLNTNSYEKGSWVLHMLRQQLGDSVFHKCIRNYYAAYAGRNADTKDLQKIFEAISGKNLEQFFKQWLYTGENLKLDIKRTYDSKKKTASIIITQLQSEVFSFPLEIRFGVAKGKPTIIKLDVTKKTETISFRAPNNSFFMKVDPNTSLLAEFSVSKAK